MGVHSPGLPGQHEAAPLGAHAAPQHPAGLARPFFWVKSKRTAGTDRASEVSKVTA